MNTGKSEWTITGLRMEAFAARTGPFRKFELRYGTTTVAYDHITNTETEGLAWWLHGAFPPCGDESTDWELVVLRAPATLAEAQLWAADVIQRHLYGHHVTGWASDTVPEVNAEERRITIYTTTGHRREATLPLARAELLFQMVEDGEGVLRLEMEAGNARAGTVRIPARSVDHVVDVSVLAPVMLPYVD